LNAANIVIGAESQTILSKISSSDNKAKSRIYELAEEIEKFWEKRHRFYFSFFSLQCDDTTEEAQCCQLLVYSRFVDAVALKEEMLFSKELKTTSKASDVLAAFSDFFLRK
jgi:hypothetical protein